MQNGSHLWFSKYVPNMWSDDGTKANEKRCFDTIYQWTGYL